MIKCGIGNVLVCISQESVVVVCNCEIFDWSVLLIRKKRTVNFVYRRFEQKLKPSLQNNDYNDDDDDDAAAAADDDANVKLLEPNAFTLKKNYLQNGILFAGEVLLLHLPMVLLEMLELVVSN